MKTILQASISATGGPSEVRARINDQVALATSSGASPEHGAALSAMRAFIEKAVAGVSEDDTLAVAGTISVTVAAAPPIVTAKRQAERDAAAAEVAGANARAEELRRTLVATQDELAAARAPNNAAIDDE